MRTSSGRNLMAVTIASSTNDNSVRAALRSPHRLKTEVLAGLVVALALIPEAISFSIIAGVDPRVGTVRVVHDGSDHRRRRRTTRNDLRSLPAPSHWSSLH